MFVCFFILKPIFALDEALKDLQLVASDGNQKIEIDSKEPDLDQNIDFIRKKDRTERLTDSEVFQELKKICYPGDPYRRFERSKELGAGLVSFIFNLIRVEIHLFFYFKGFWYCLYC